MHRAVAPLLAFLACVLVWPLGVAAANLVLPFRSLGPAVSGGRVAAVAGSDRDPSLYYAGAAGGGVWKSTNAGQSWVPVFDATGMASIGAIALDPSNVRTVWVGTGEANPRNDVSEGNGVYKSADGGATWTNVLPLSHAAVSSLLVDPRDPRHVLVGVLGDPFADATDRGVYRTTDGGATWSKTLFAGLRSGICDMAMDPAAPQTVYAGVWEFRRTPWSLQSGGDQDGLYRSLDGGASWSLLSGNGLPAGTLGRIAVAIAPSQPKRIYALVESKHGLLWRSDDAGASWNAIDANTLIDERPFYFSHLFVDPTNADRLWSVSVHLTQSTDGGRTFTTTGKGLHGDHHAMWISADGQRIIEGNDGGVGLSFDGGASWRWDTVLPISQLYHVGFSREQPYRVCAALQDDGTYCAPANPLDPRGMSASQWRLVGNGDGTWAQFDPRDPQLVWAAFGGGDIGGDLYLYDSASGDTRSIAPYPRDQNAVDPLQLVHRFNWETPIAFDPFDGRIAFTAGEAVFETHDRGAVWQTISPDLTRNIEAHQVITGGVTLDGTGAETSDTILTIAPSQAMRGELWIGTDDGKLQITRDAGRHWRDVTPSGIAPFGRFASISPSATRPGTAYAVDDRHLLGDRAPYLLATDDFGARWRRIDAGLPPDQQARSVLVDPRDPQLLYAGLERSLWASFDGGARWEQLQGLPPASVRDLQMQPDSGDLLVATHGRGLYVLDDAEVLAQLRWARSTREALLTVPPATRWVLHRSWNTPYDAGPAPYGAIVSYYLAAPALKPPSAEIADASGQVIRHIPSDALASAAGIDRFAWDLRTDPARPWTFAAPWNQGAAGVPVAPGTYTLRLRLDGHNFVQHIVVQPDPRLHYSQEAYETSYELERLLLDDLSRLDDALNAMSRARRWAPNAPASQSAQMFTALLTSNPANDQDDDFLTDRVRERVQSMLAALSSGAAPPTQAQLRQSALLHDLVVRAMNAYTILAPHLATGARAT